MSIINAVLQGVIQGLTEFLPVSSDGHLTLFQHFTGQSGEGSLMFTLLLHLGTLVSVFIVFRKTILELIIEAFAMIRDIFTGKFSYKNANPTRKMIIMIFFSLIPLLVFYFVKDYFTQLAEDGDIIVEGVLFIFTGTMLFLADRCTKGHKTAAEMKISDSLWIGTFQGLAALPAVSRSGSTMSVALLRGFSREYAVSFSFIMGIPAIIGANIFEIKDAVEEAVSVEILPLLIGVLVSAVVGFFAIKLIKYLIETDRFVVFAYYTLALGIVTIGVGIYEHIFGRIIIG